MTRKERFDDMERALRAHCPDEELLDELSFNLYAANMVIHGYGNIEQSLAEFVEQLKVNMSKRIKDNIGLKYSQSAIQHFHDKAQSAIDATLREFLNSLNNKNQGDN